MTTLNVADMSLEDASLLAQKYAQLQQRHDELDTMFAESMGRRADDVKAILRQFLELNGLDELIDEETGLGVRIAERGRRSTKWDTLGMAESVLLTLKDLGLVDVRTALFDKWHKESGSIATQEALKWRIDGESAAPFQVVKGDGR